VEPDVVLVVVIPFELLIQVDYLLEVELRLGAFLLLQEGPDLAQ
jgi:hypothetical protein